MRMMANNGGARVLPWNAPQPCGLILLNRYGLLVHLSSRRGTVRRCVLFSHRRLGWSTIRSWFGTSTGRARWTAHRSTAHQLASQCYAVVLAGGRGSRLHHLTDWRAKPAVPFAGTLKIIDFPLSNCVNSGIRRIAVLTQYKSQSLIRHIERGWSFLSPSLGEFVDVAPAQQRMGKNWYGGTADAVFQNLHLLRDAGARYVLILAGDHVYKMNYAAMLADHVHHGAGVTLACIEVPLSQAHHFGVVTVDADARVVDFVEKPDPAQAHPLDGAPDQVLASMGVYVFDVDFLCAQLARDAADPQSSHDFGKDLLPWLVARHPVMAHRFADSCVNMVGERPYWRDVGTIDAYWEANMDLTNVVPELNLYDDQWPILSLQPQLPPAKFVFDDEGRRGIGGGLAGVQRLHRQRCHGAPIHPVLQGACGRAQPDRGFADIARCGHRATRASAQGGGGQTLRPARRFLRRAGPGARQPALSCDRRRRHADHDRHAGATR